MLFTVITALFVEFNIAMGISNNGNNRCLRKYFKSNSNCDNIYIWKSEREEFISLLNATFSRAQGNDLRALEGKTVRVIADNMLPYITSNETSQELGGYLGDIWSIVQSALKFESQIISTNYTEGLEAITSGMGDVMLAAIVGKKGLKNVEYSQPYFYNWYHIYLKKPKATASSSSYLRTLQDDLWFASISLFVSLTFCLWLTMFIMNKYSKRHGIVSLPSCFLTVCSGFLNQGYDPKINCFSGRFQIFVSVVFGFLLYSAMNAVLVAQLAIFELKLPFKSLDEVAIKRTHSLCVRTNSFVYNDFIDVNRSLLPKWNNIVNGVGCLDINNQENVAKVICKGEVAVLENRVVISSVTKKYKLPCELSYVKTKLFTTPNFFLLSKDFKDRNVILKFMKRLRSFGILNRIEKTLLFDKINSEDMEQVTLSKVTIHHVGGILSMLVVMIIISLVILAIEHIFKKCT